MRHSLPLILIATSLAGCTQRPDRLEPIAIPPSQYQDLSCDELTKLYTETHDRLDQLVASQNQAIVGDVRIFGANIGTVTNPEKQNLSSDIRLSMGRVNAIDYTMRRKTCTLPKGES
ncbi:hypothetical protein FJU08_03060 [Martelella alba]|uniref:Lipoprotein n=1 Tax=Martelella alba TaxID=2590451 RepID=A0A506UJN7_9HYPH|nr:hypothetical protein [Martelella alba]TPW33547.1 hypothetical protein FJU08_03060 [Martelella alba]